MAVPEDAELVRWKLDRVAKAGAHLMGRTTYQKMAAYWPHSEHPYAAPMNDIPKILFSASLREGSWPATRIARGDWQRRSPRSRPNQGPTSWFTAARASPRPSRPAA